MSSVLDCHNLTVHYEQRPAITDITLAIAPGRITSLLGPNGAGKSTLLRVLAGMQPASHGDVQFQGSALRGTNPDITYVPQRAGADWTFPISVMEAVTLGIAQKRPRWRRLSTQDTHRAHQALASVGIADLANVQIGSLSGGQQQRVFLARALLAEGQVMLLDEPFAGVDIPTQELFVTIFDDLRERGVAVVYATHDLGQATRTSDTMVLINRTMVATGPPATVMTEVNLRATFGGQVITVPAHQEPSVPPIQVGAA